MSINKASRFYLFGLLLILVMYVVATKFVSHLTQRDRERKDKLQVVTSFYPLYFFAREIGGEQVQVDNITPVGSEPHDYEPTTRDISQIERASLLIINGAHLESWADKVKDNQRTSNVRIIEVSQGLATQEIEEGAKKIQDPHIWLDPILAKRQVEIILGGFVDIDREHKTIYENNARKLIKKLDLLDKAFKEGLKDCAQKNIVTSHAAFGYVASRYNLIQIPISGLSPDEEPSPKRLAEIAKFTRTNHVKYIFFETLISPKLAETIAREVGAKTIVFNPLEGLTQEQQSKAQDYFSIQRDNLSNLRTALECK